MTGSNLKNIRFVATGGTIAGYAPSAQQMTGYEAGVFPVEKLLASVEGLDTIANVTAEQLFSMDSKDMTSKVQLAICRRVSELLKRDDVDGLVLTHGTDTMEETAFLLQLVIKSAKPVVITGAMRPATALSADGPANLLNAFKVAVSASSYGKGIMICVNDQIYSASDAVKFNAFSVGYIASPIGGPIGSVIGGVPRFYYDIAPLHTVASEFDIDDIEELPRVDIIYTHSSADRVLIDAAVAAGAQGIVYAGSGMGSVHCDEEPALAEAVKKGVIVIRSSRVPLSIVTGGPKEWYDEGFIDSLRFNPPKARMLLQLALCYTRDAERIREIFAKY